MQLDAQQPQFREPQQQLPLTASRLSPFETAIVEALGSRGQTPTAFSGLGKGQATRKVSNERRIGAGSGRISPQPATTTTNPLVPAHLLVKPRTPLIVVEAERLSAVTASTPLPATPHTPMAFAAATLPAAPANPSDNAAWGGFPGQAAQLATAYCSAACRIEGEGSELAWTHQHQQKYYPAFCAFCASDAPDARTLIANQDATTLPHNTPDATGRSTQYSGRIRRHLTLDSIFLR